MIWLAVPPVAAAVIGGVVWWLRRRYLVVTVLGRSMLPTYADGDRVLVRRRRSGRGVRVGDVAVADLPVWLYRVGAGPPGTAREPDPAARPTSAWSVLPQSERVVKRVAPATRSRPASSRAVSRYRLTRSCCWATIRPRAPTPAGTGASRSGR